MKDRTKVNKTMDKGYERYFDPAERSNVDPADYPAPENMATAVRPAREDTRAQYEAMYNSPEAPRSAARGLQGRQGRAVGGRLVRHAPAAR